MSDGIGLRVDEIGLRVDEAKHLAERGRCDGCGHLNALHTFHCCEYCNVGECACEDGAVAAPDPEDAA